MLSIFILKIRESSKKDPILGRLFSAERLKLVSLGMISQNLILKEAQFFIEPGVFFSLTDITF